jgi:peptidoglycan/LPS O-acetylase OafA/YrhL
MYFAVHNPYVLLHYAEQFTYQLIANAPLLVDLFFVVSAFLLTLSFLNNHRQMMEIKANGLMANFKLFGKLLLQRYIR